MRMPQSLRRLLLTPRHQLPLHSLVSSVPGSSESAASRYSFPSTQTVSKRSSALVERSLLRAKARFVEGPFGFAVVRNSVHPKGRYIFDHEVFRIFFRRSYNAVQRVL